MAHPTSSGVEVLAKTEMVLTIQRDDVVRGGLGLGVRAVAASSWPTAAARGGTGRRRRALMVVAQGLHANRGHDDADGEV